MVLGPDSSGLSGQQANGPKVELPTCNKAVALQAQQAARDSVRRAGAACRLYIHLCLNCCRPRVETGHCLIIALLHVHVVGLIHVPVTVNIKNTVAIQYLA